MPSPALNPKQAHARDEALRFAEDPSNAIFMVSGLAGTGKTTVLVDTVQVLQERGHKVAVCTPTGKAAHVINKKAGGVFQATTLHKTLSVRPIDHHAEIHERLDELDAKEASEEPLTLEEEAEIQALFAQLDEKKSNKLSFKPIPLEDFTYDILVFDEASMIGLHETYDKLIGRIPVPKIFFGDAAQLPPVQDVPALNLDKADVRLTDIMRQAAGSGILPVSHFVQAKKDWPTLKFMAQYKDITIRKDFHPDMVAGFETSGHQILCWKNVTRHEVSQRVRAARGVNFMSETYPFLPVVDEQIMVDENDFEKRLLKGQMLTFKGYTMGKFGYNPTASPYLMTGKFEDEEGKERVLTISLTDTCEGYDMSGFANAANTKRWADKSGIKVMWPYCLTVHKAQGSEWDKVLYLAEMPQGNKEWRKHAYTAITRAAKEVVLCDFAFRFDKSV